MLGLILAAALLSQDLAPPAVTPLIVEADRKPARPIPTERDIERQLDDLLAREPRRIVCINRRPLGTLLMRQDCATLREWYSLESARDTAGKVAIISGPKGGGAAGPGGRPRPPAELVSLIQAHYDKPTLRAAAEARARQRRAAEALAASTPAAGPDQVRP